jgi:hypothetical protein
MPYTIIFTIKVFSHPNRTRFIPHVGPTRRMVLEVDRVEGLCSTKKSQFGESLCRKRRFSSPVMTLPALGTHL